MELTTKKSILERVLERLVQFQKDMEAEVDSTLVVDFLRVLGHSILKMELYPNGEIIFGELVKRNKNFHYLLVSEVLDKYKSTMIDSHYNVLIDSINHLKRGEYSPSAAINALMAYKPPKADSSIFFAHEYLIEIICVGDGRKHLHKVVQQELIPTVEGMLVECSTEPDMKPTKPVATKKEEAVDPISGLTCSQRELLYLLTETCSDVIQATQKVLRRGYESVSRLNPDSLTNKHLLEKELRKVGMTIDHLLNNDGINSGEDK